MSKTVQEIRFCFRILARRPLLTVTAVVTLALAVGANTAIFSVVHGVLLQPLPYPESDRLLAVWGSHDKIGKETASLPDFIDWKKQSQAFESLAGFANWAATLTGAGEPTRVRASRVTGDFFSVLGVSPQAGRTLHPEDDRPDAPKVTVISQALSRRLFGESSLAVGQKVNLNGNPYEIVGVMPASFQHPVPQARGFDIWAPLALSPETQGRRGDFLRVVGRLKPGATREQAESNLKVIMAALEKEYPATNAGWSALVQPLRTEIVGNVETALLFLLSAVGAVLLIACGNVANLLLSSAADRKREIAVRSALGAGRFSLLRQFLLEGVTIGCMGGAVGLALAVACLYLLKGLAPAELPRLEAIQINTPVLAFTLAISVLSGLFFGLLAGLRVANPNVNEVLKEGGIRGSESSRARRTREALVVGQLALALALVFGAGLLLRSLSNLMTVDAGFDSSNVMSFALLLPSVDYPEDHQVVAFYAGLLEKLSSLPGVAAVGAVTDLPFSGGNYLAFAVEGRPPLPAEAVQDAQVASATEGFFETLRIPLVRGREFDSRDRMDSPQVALINQEMVRRYWPNEDPLGSRINFGPPDSNPWVEIVVVVGDVRNEGVAEKAYPAVYLLQSQSASRLMSVLVRTSGDPGGLTSSIRELVRKMAPSLPLQNLARLEQVRSDAVALPRFRSLLLGSFAFLALSMAAIGLYGVMAHSVSRRIEEVGIRMALGATAGRVTWLVVGQGMKLAAIGILLGVCLSLLAGRTMSGFLFGVGERDPVTFAGVAAALTAVALLACLAPALRAARIDPIKAIRRA